MWIIERKEKMVSDFLASHDVEQSERSAIRNLIMGDGRNLQRYKPENRTYNMCLAAVMEDGTAIEFVPEKMRTKEMYKKLIEINPDAEEFLPMLRR